MAYLLDTHVLLWALTDPQKISSPALKVIESKACKLYVSAASAWEISTKQRLGRLPQAEALIAGYSRHLDYLHVERLPISDEHSLLAGSLDWKHRDPFDRMLAAQAMLESLTLITCDDAFESLRGINVLW